MKSNGDWKRLLGLLEFKPSIGGKIVRPDESVLNDWEIKAKATLPPSYRSFATTIGAGEIGGYFRVFVPGQGRGIGDLSTFQSLIEEVKENFQDVCDSLFLQTMIPFADSIGGDVVVWFDPRKKRNDEPPVYMIFRDGRPTMKIADNFADFINSVCLGRKAAKVLGDPAWKPAKLFIPYGYTKKVRA